MRSMITRLTKVTMLWGVISSVLLLGGRMPYMLQFRSYLTARWINLQKKVIWMVGSFQPKSGWALLNMVMNANIWCQIMTTSATLTIWVRTLKRVSQPIRNYTISGGRTWRCLSLRRVKRLEGFCVQNSIKSKRRISKLSERFWD